MHLSRVNARRYLPGWLERIISRLRGIRGMSDDLRGRVSQGRQQCFSKMSPCDGQSYFEFLKRHALHRLVCVCVCVRLCECFVSQTTKWIQSKRLWQTAVQLQAESLKADWGDRVNKLHDGKLRRVVSSPAAERRASIVFSLIVMRHP